MIFLKCFIKNNMDVRITNSFISYSAPEQELFWLNNEQSKSSFVQ